MKTRSPACAPHECLRRDWMYTSIVCVNVRGRARAGRRQQRHTLVSSNRPKKKKNHTHPNSLMGLCQTRHISQLLGGLNYDDIIVRPQMHKNVYLASSLWARTFLNPFASHHRELQSNTKSEDWLLLSFFSLSLPLSFGRVPSLWLPGSC